jgi:hypothetical protein
MRQVSIEETKAVGGADCGDLTMSVGLTGVSISGSLNDWGDCYNRLSDAVSGFGAHYSTGIPYGEAHVG